MEWLCERCCNIEAERREVVEPTDRVRIIRRFMSLHNDYDLLGMEIESKPDELVFRVRLPNYDMSEMRAIKHKQQETGFIRVDELMRLQKAGFNRPSDIRPKPTPTDRRTLLERTRQQMFKGERLP
jgi:hypothetical protein